MAHTSPISFALKQGLHLEWLFMALLFVLPLGVALLTNMAFLLLFVACILTVKRPDWKRALGAPIVYFSVAFYLFHWVSLLWVSELDAAWAGLETKFSFLLAPLFAVAAAPGFRAVAMRNVCTAFVLGVFAACLLALGVAAIAAWQEGAWFYDPGDSFGRRYFFSYTHLAKPVMHPGYFSTYIGIAIFTSIWLLKQVKRKWGLYFLIAFFFVMMVLLQGRINLMALFIVFISGALYYAFKKKAYLWLVAPLLPVLLFAAFVFFGPEKLKERYLQFPDFSYDISGRDFNSATFRLAEWSCAMDVIAEHPWLGTGIGDHRTALLEAYRARGFWVGLERKYNAHNQYIETWLMLGVVGVGLLLALLLHYATLAWKEKRFLIFACLLFFSISMLTESMLERAWAIVLFNVFFPLLASIRFKSN